MSLTITAELLRALSAKHHPQADIPAALAADLEHLESIRRKIEKLQADKRKAQECLKNTLRELDKQLTEIHEHCPHPLSRRHADPSGGSDSWDECVVCGAETWKHEPGGYDG